MTQADELLLVLARMDEEPIEREGLPWGEMPYEVTYRWRGWVVEVRGRGEWVYISNIAAPDGRLWDRWPDPDGPPSWRMPLVVAYWEPPGLRDDRHQMQTSHWGPA